ncbi:MAG TPA: hypothetical protein VE195_01510, partial [Acidobacteriaceae bacterium]|nr:hypothetical protein [Acidobacteriaceae bacterium]
ELSSLPSLLTGANVARNGRSRFQRSGSKLRLNGMLHGFRGCRGVRDHKYMAHSFATLDLIQRFNP